MKPTDIITWRMTREQQLQLERIHHAFTGISELTDNGDQSDVHAVMSLVGADLSNLMDDIERLNPDKHAELRAQFEVFLSSGYSNHMEATLEEHENMRQRGRLKDNDDPLWKQIEADIRRGDLEKKLEEKGI